MSHLGAQNRHTNKQASSSQKILATAPKVFLLMTASGLLLLFTSAVIASRLPSPLKMITPLALFSLYISSALGGIISSKLLDSPASYFCAAATSSVFTLSIIFFKLFFMPAQTSDYPSALSAVLHVLIIVTSVLGAHLQNKSPIKRPKTRSKSRRKK